MIFRIVLYCIFGVLVIISNTDVETTIQTLSRDILIFSGGFILDLMISFFEGNKYKYCKIIRGTSFVILAIYILPSIVDILLPNKPDLFFSFFIWART